MQDTREFQRSLAWSFVWWPCLDADLEKYARECKPHQKIPPKAPLHPWEWPEFPCSRIHIDYAGPFMGKMFLVLVDAHSKWMDVHVVRPATSLTTIKF